LRARMIYNGRGKGVVEGCHSDAQEGRRGGEKKEKSWKLHVSSPLRGGEQGKKH